MSALDVSDSGGGDPSHIFDSEQDLGPGRAIDRHAALRHRCTDTGDLVVG
jgi:hypothetical protein